MQSARPLFVTLMVTVITCPMETCVGYAIMEGIASAGAGSWTMESAGAAVVVAGRTGFLSVPETEPLKWTVPVPVAENVQMNKCDVPPAISTGDWAALKNTLGEPDEVKPKTGVAARASTVPLFVTLMYTLYKVELLDMEGGAIIVAESAVLFWTFTVPEVMTPDARAREVF